MPSLSNSALRLLRRLLGTPQRGPGPESGSPTVLDGNTAIAHTEAGICDIAGIGGSFPADAAGLAWRLEQRRLRVNAFGAPLGSRGAEGPRGALAAAIGLALTGARATCFLSAPDLSGCRDLLASASARRLPLVLHLAGRGVGGTGAVLGNGHDAFHIGADVGGLVLVAANVQEAIDFTLIARRVCEQALLPGLVAMDGPRTALALQDARPASRRLIRDLLGDPNDRVPCFDSNSDGASDAAAHPGEVAGAHPAQQLLFGDQRRRLPRWHDVDHPLMLGALQPASAAAPGRAAAHAYLDAPLDGIVDQALQRFAELTGREHRGVSTHRIDDAKLILLAMGSAIETAEAAADRLRETDRLKVGVVGLRRLHPFPGAELARLLGRGICVCVLDCADVPLTDDAPLLRQLRSALDRATDKQAQGAAMHPGYPALATKDRPRLLSVIYGLGGLALRAGDLLHLCRVARKLRRSRVYLGVDFAPVASAYPKRQVLLDQLRRAYPHAADLGLAGSDADAPADAGRGKTAAGDLRPGGAVTVAIQRVTGVDNGLTLEAAALLHRIDDGGLRALSEPFVEPWGETCIERITSSAQPLRAPGDDGPVDLLLSLTDRELSAVAPIEISANGLLLVQTRLPDERLWPRLPEALRRRLKDKALRLFLLPPAVDASPASVNQDTPCGEGRAIDYLLGALCGLLQQRGLLDLSRRRLLGLRAEMLRHAVADVDARLAAFEAGLDAPRQVDATRLPLVSAQAHAGTSPGEDARALEQTPALVRRIGGSSSGLHSLPRFWGRIGVLYHNSDTAELSPDPLLAIGAVPALSSGFRDLSASRERLPLFDPDLCTSCGACWSACPESAIAAVAITPTQLIDSAFSAKLGTGNLDALRPLASKLAAGIVALCQRPEYAPSTAAELLDSAYAQMEARLPFPAERKQAIAEALGQLIAAIGPAPLVATEALFHAPESEQPGRGVLLALSLNPNSCKACGLCVAVCAPGALRNERQSARVLAEARQARLAWERLPDTAPDVIQRLAALPEPGALASLLLGQHAAGAMIGGDGNEPGSGARLALRLALSALSARQASAFSDLADEIDDTRARIAALVRETLADALPADDLDALAERLRGVAARQADLGELLGGAGPVINGSIDSAVDATRLRRLVDLARDLSDWAWRLRQGDHGLGRAGFGIVLSPGAAVGWAGAFPDNPYAEPVVLDWSGDGAQLAAGLLEGQLRQATRDLILLRKARLELDRPADASRLWADLEGLSWRDLDDRELACCPSLLLVGDSASGGRLAGSAGASLGGVGLAELHRLLGADLPLRVLLLADLDLGLDMGLGMDMGPGSVVDLPLAGLDDGSIDLGLLAVSRRDAYIAQCSIAAPGHLAASMASAFRHRGPSLLHLYAPSPRRHGFATDQTLDRARAAFEARMLPLFRYDPAAEGLFGSRIDLAGNPDADTAWATAADGSAITPAHWALGDARFAGLLRPLPDDAPEPTPLIDYLAMDDGTLMAREGAKRTPYIEPLGDLTANGADWRRLEVDPALVALCSERQHAWQVLQELAGVVTPFTARVQQQAEARVATEHQAEIAALTAEHERRIQALRADYDQELRRDIKDRLMSLAGYSQAPPTPATQARPDA